MQESCGLGPRRTGRILNLLELVRSSDDPADLVDAVVERAEAQKRLEQSRVEMMRTYAETTRCRTEWLQGYFGEEDRQRCGTCDNCRSGTAEGKIVDANGTLLAHGTTTCLIFEI